MFHYAPTHWLAFLSAAVLLNLSPGPDIAFILGNTIRGGKRSGFAGLFGVWTGTAVHVMMAAAGLSAILAASAPAFSAVKWIGAAYLIWLGTQALRSKDQEGWVGEGQSVAKSRIYWQGVLVSVLNPKVAVFFLAFLPQFIVDGAGPAWAQLLLHGSLIIAVAAVIEPPLIMFGNRIARALQRDRRIGLWMDRGLGAMFVMLGVRLAISTR